MKYRIIPRWPFIQRSGHRPVFLKAIFVAEDAGAPMRAVDSVQAVAATGLAGDRYSRDSGHWQSIEACQVTLISEEDLARAAQALTLPLRQRLAAGGHRRNLVVSGIDIRRLEGRRFRIGAAVFRYGKPRPPCGWLDQVEGKGMARALSHYSGVCITVETSGKLTIGDRLEVLD